VALDDLHGQAAHVLDQDNPQRDGDGPKLADHQGLDLLIGADEPGQHRPGQQAVSMGDIGPGHAQDPGVARERAVGELRQLPVIARRQVFRDLLKLVFNKVEVVQKPFRSRRDGLASLQRMGAGLIGAKQHLGVFLDPIA